MHVSIALHVIRKRGMAPLKTPPGQFRQDAGQAVRVYCVTNEIRRGMDAAKYVYMRVRLVRTRLVKCTGMCISLSYIGFEAAHALRML